jgi:carbonic anhydrase/acetyltransferase-like protein (isoleucine patch superfamily)
MPLFEFEGRQPEVSPAAWIAPNATLVGDVRVEAKASIWYGAVLRADFGPILVRRGANIQDGSVLHGGNDPVTEVGEGATIGHLCVIHGAVIGSEALVGNGATVLDGVIVGCRALIAAGCTVPPGMIIPDDMLAAGCRRGSSGRSPAEQSSGCKRIPPSTKTWPGVTPPPSGPWIRNARPGGSTGDRRVTIARNARCGPVAPGEVRRG